MKLQFELTDTFGGEANYGWVRRGTKIINQWPEPTERCIVKAAKAWAGWTGVYVNKEHHGDTIVLKPRHLHQVLFINIED